MGKNIIQKDSYVLVVETNEDEIIGFAVAYKRKSNQIDNSSDLTSLYLLEEYHGQGIGKKLFKEIFIYFKKCAYGKVFVEVLEDNNTRHFYEYYGAKLIETVQIKIGGKIINELIYEWDNIEDVIAKV